MTEPDRAKRFSAAVERLLAGESAAAAPGEAGDLLELAQALAAHDTRAYSQVEPSLRRQLLSRQKGLPPMLTRHPTLLRLSRLLAALALTASLALIILAVPPVRTLAQAVIRRIGNFVITSEPSDAEQYVATITSGTPTPTPDPHLAACTDCAAVVSGRLTPAEASAKAGFPVYAPAYVPAGYWLSSRDVLTTTATTTAYASYRMELDPPLHAGLQMAGIIAIGQTLAREGTPLWEKGVGDVPVVEVTVHGQPGVWLEQIPVIPFQAESSAWDYERWNQLIWAEAGYSFMLQTNMPVEYLPLEEMLKIAASLAP